MERVVLNTEQIYNLLKAVPRISLWPDSEVRGLAGMVEGIKLSPGELLPEDDFASDDAYVVYSGQIRQSIPNQRGGDFSFRTVGPGGAFVQHALFRGEGYDTKIHAVQETILLRINASNLAQLLSKHPELWAVFFANTAARLQTIPLLRILSDEQIDQVARVTEFKEFRKGETICTVGDEPGSLWLIDWGQVQITEQAQTGMSGAGRLATQPATTRVTVDQGFVQLPHILTAGNWFISGLVKLPQILTVTGVAQTQVKLLRVPGELLEQVTSVRDFADVEYQLRHRLNIASRLEDALHQNEFFADLDKRHWEQLATVTGRRHVPAGLDVTRQGQFGTTMFVLAEGVALVRAQDDQGRERPRHFMRKNEPNGSRGDQAVDAGLGEEQKLRHYYGVNQMLRGDRHHATVRSVAGPNDIGVMIDGSDWLTIQRDDLLYLLSLTPALWTGTYLFQKLAEVRQKKVLKWLQDEEDIRLFRRRHILWLLLRLAAVALIALGVLGVFALIESIFSVQLETATYVLVAIAVFLPLAMWFAIDYYNDYYVITNRRVVRKDAVFLIYENRLEAPLERVQDITVATDLLAKIFNYGRVAFRTAATGGTIVFEMVPRPTQVEDVVRSQQALARAGAKAEQRENLRNKLLSGLKMRLMPETPERVLPPGTEPVVNVSELSRVGAILISPFTGIARWLRDLPNKLFRLELKLLPKHARTEILKEREAAAKKRAAQMQDVRVYRKHIFFLIWSAIIPIAFIAVTMVLFILTELNGVDFGAPTWLRYVYIGFLVFCLFWLWYRVENWRNDKYILTKTHIIDITALPLGLFEERRQAEWDKVQDANYEVPSFWANLFRWGTVKVATASTYGQFDFVNVPNPRLVQQEIFMRLQDFRQSKEAAEVARQQSALSETLEIYTELIRERTSGFQPQAKPNGGQPSP